MSGINGPKQNNATTDQRETKAHETKNGTYADDSEEKSNVAIAESTKKSMQVPDILFMVARSNANVVVGPSPWNVGM